MGLTLVGIIAYGLEIKPIGGAGDEDILPDKTRPEYFLLRLLYDFKYRLPKSFSSNYKHN